jgi:hypothetical protein
MRIEHLKNVKHHKTIRMNSGWSDLSYDLEYRFWVTPVEYHDKFPESIAKNMTYYVLNIECVAKSPYEDQDPGIPTYILEDWIVDNILDDAYDSLITRMNLDNILRFEPDRKGGITLVTIMDPQNNRAYHSPPDDLFNNDTSKFVWRNQLFKKHIDDVRRHREDEEREEEENNV